MRDLKRIFQTLDQLDAPVSWSDVEGRRPGRVPWREPGRPRRAVAVVVALVMAAAGIAFGVRALVVSPAHRPMVQSPSPSLPHQHTVRRFVDGQPCPQAHYPGIPSDSGCISYASADFDGDGHPDTFAVYAHPLDTQGYPRAWHARIALGSGRTVEAGLPSAGFAKDLWILGAADANGDGTDEAIIRVGGGAASDSLHIFLLLDDHLIQASRRTEALSVNVGSVAATGNGGGCRKVGGSLKLLESGAWTAGGRWHWIETFYRWRGTSLVQEQTLRGVTTRLGAKQYQEFRCGKVFLSGVTLATHRTSTLLGSAPSA